MRYLSRAFLFVSCAGGFLGLTASVHAEIQFSHFDQTLNHLDQSDKRTFHQRYFVDSSFASGPNAPVLYFLGNEGELGSLVESAGYVYDLAKTLKAHLVGLEHRYYGQSIPFDTLTADTLKYLTVENALADFAQFEDFAVTQLALHGKWVALGRSYGAALSAYYRESFPDRVVGALSASPALFWEQNWNAYDDRITKVAGPECVQSYHQKILEPIEKLFQNQQNLAKYKALYHASDISDDVDFLNALGGSTSFMLQMKGPSSLCPLMKQADPEAAFSKALFEFSQNEGFTVWDFSDEGALRIQSSRYMGSFGMRQWFYQSCTELGLFSTPVNDPSRTFSSTLLSGLTTPEKECQKVIGISAAPVDPINRKYYLPLLGLNSKVSRILVTNGSLDPTATLSISKENSNDSNPGIKVITVEGGAHHEEMNSPSPSDPKSFDEARAVILSTLQEWLK